MVNALPRGGNTSLQAGLAAEANQLLISLEYTGDNPSRPSVDAVAFLLGENGKVRGDADMVFYNHKSIAEGGLTMLDATENAGLRQQLFHVDVTKLPAGIVKVCFCIVADGSSVRAVGQLSRLAIRVFGGQTREPFAYSEFNMPGAQEAALILGELYLRNGEWKFKSIGQGFASGLGALAESYGIIVAEAAQASGSMTRPAGSIPAAAAGRSAVPAQRIERPHMGFDEITINLVWNATPDTSAEAPKKGLLGGLLPLKPKPIDLDLCCLYELSDGYRGVVQALGDSYGAYNSAPFMELMGDERKGSGTQGEVIRINGARWNEVTRILVYAMIFDGAPNWALASGRCVIRVPDQVPISVKLDQNVNDRRACTIALIENDGGHLSIQKRVEAFRNPREMDDYYGWGLRWSAGTKD